MSSSESVSNPMVYGQYHNSTEASLFTNILQLLQLAHGIYSWKQPGLAYLEQLMVLFTPACGANEPLSTSGSLGMWVYPGLLDSLYTFIHESVENYPNMLNVFANSDTYLGNMPIVKFDHILHKCM